MYRCKSCNKVTEKHVILFIRDAYTRGGGGGVTSMYAYWVYAANETPIFSFRSGAYHFHKLPKNPFRSITILHFLAEFAIPETIFKISLISTHSSPPTAAAHSRSAAPRVSGRSGALHFHAQNGSSSVPEPRIFKLKTTRARSGTLANFHFAAAHTY